MKITKYGHACLLIEEGSARILIDPGEYSAGFDEAKGLDAMLITHQHRDHVTSETLAQVRENNRDVAVYADAGTVKKLSEEGVKGLEAVQAGQELHVGEVDVKVYGEKHAAVHPSIPQIENVGYMIGGRFFYPGDNFTDPGVPVEILGLPLGAPWLKVSEMIDYVLAVKPKVAIPVHDAVLAMPEMNVGILKGFTGPAGIDVRVVANGETCEL